MLTDAERIQYQPEYRKKNREKVNEWNKRWAQENSEKSRESQLRYWLRTAEGAGIQ